MLAGLSAGVLIRCQMIIPSLFLTIKKPCFYAFF
ncbi:hypothetical protein MED92_07316 [Oceanospirillum sp. MED92]|uniref:Uncharacterized protein n=1 Tax=Neptuniibacter caesariensis TaxID=207954 RepID=A0A7U8C7U8_NEPCE|nr:hypothetical protein MED92_07316 [Oceanospirillum sp. MED92] [Neptuniibacter caesariensis]